MASCIIHGRLPVSLSRAAWILTHITTPPIDSHTYDPTVDSHTHDPTYGVTNYKWSDLTNGGAVLAAGPVATAPRLTLPLGPRTVQLEITDNTLAPLGPRVDRAVATFNVVAATQVPGAFLEFFQGEG
jgi:hypothetical protein